VPSELQPPKLDRASIGLHHFRRLMGRAAHPIIELAAVVTMAKQMRHQNPRNGSNPGAALEDELAARLKTSLA